MRESPGLNVLIADGQVATRRGIRGAIEVHGMHVVAEAADLASAVQMALTERPHVCVIAAALPGGGMEATRRIKSALTTTKIVMMTQSASDDELFRALRAGVDGYLLMSTSAGRLPHAIAGVVNGEAALPRKMTAGLITAFRERGATRRVMVPRTGRGVEVTAREFQVLERLRRQERTGEIAAALGISEVTVRRHVASLLHKLACPNRRRMIELLQEPQAQAPPSAESD